jgi:hypothetical protein
MKRILIPIVIAVICLLGCGFPGFVEEPESSEQEGPATTEPSPAPATTEDAELPAAPAGEIEVPAAPAEEDSGETPVPEPEAPAVEEPVTLPPSLGDLIQPEQLVYMGAFRLPPDQAGADDRHMWGYSGAALAYRPDGDSSGADDGFPGSLFISGHDVWNDVAEISIPAPSLAREVETLPSADVLQGFSDVRGGLFDSLIEIPRVGLVVLQPQGSQSSAKLYLAWGQHFHDEEATIIPSHAWSELDLSQPETQGAWWVGDESLYSVNGYLFEIPAPVADQYLNGARLATGRFRDGGWSGMGPALFAIAPWQEGNPPAAGARLLAQTLLLYGHSRGDSVAEGRLGGYHHSDEWEGGAWLTLGDASAVIFVGVKGSGYLWYGYPSPANDGAPCPAAEIVDMVTCYAPDGAPCTTEEIEGCEGYFTEARGWWSSRFDAQMLFYDPAHLLAVAHGELAADAPQPYTVLDLDENLFVYDTVEGPMLGFGDQRRYRLGETAYDRERNLLYIVERFVDEARPVIHVWGVGG